MRRRSLRPAWFSISRPRGCSRPRTRSRCVFAPRPGTAERNPGRRRQSPGWAAWLAGGLRARVRCGDRDVRCRSCAGRARRPAQRLVRRLLLPALGLRRRLRALGGVRSAGRRRRSRGLHAQVAVLVGCKNEELVVDGMVSALLRLDYPADKITLVVVDDGTGARLDAWAAEDPRLRVLHRPAGSGG